jgi:hypothetical protein
VTIVLPQDLALKSKTDYKTRGNQDEGESSLKARYIHMLSHRAVIRVACDLDHFGTELNDARRADCK